MTSSSASPLRHPHLSRRSAREWFPEVHHHHCPGVRWRENCWCSSSSAPPLRHPHPSRNVREQVVPRRPPFYFPGVEWRKRAVGALHRLFLVFVCPARCRDHCSAWLSGLERGLAATGHSRKPPDGRSLQNMPILSSNAEKDATGKAAAISMQQPPPHWLHPDLLGIDGIGGRCDELRSV